MRILILLAAAAVVSVSGQDGPVVNTTTGSIQGFTSSSRTGKPFYGFLSIPYGKAPVGNLRFQPTQPYGNWQGIRNGSQLGPECPQFDLLLRKYDGNEDCLVMQVYVPQYEGWPEKKLPVLFYIHGGGFMFGSGRFTEYGPQNYMDFPVVLVLPNYRLGVLGYLSTGDSNAYGNYAMLDQIEAMKWVQNNIASFGGDPNRVVLDGDSAGSGCVFHHLLSPLSKGLFSRVITESGTAINYWGVIDDPLSKAQKLASELNCSTNTNEQLIDCLYGKSAEEIAVKSYQLQATPFIPTEWAPVVESPGGPGFLTEKPISIIKNGRIASRVPIIIGHQKLEGYTLYADLAPTIKYNGSEYFGKQFPEQLSLFTPIQENDTDAINAIADRYYRNADVDNYTVFVEVLSEIVGDAMFTAKISQAVDLLSNAGLPVYAYIYTHVGQYCLALTFGGKCGMYSAHGDEILLQFQYFSIGQPMNKADTAVSNIIIPLWVNFAAENDLRINDHDVWPLYKTNNRTYVVLNESPTINTGTLSNNTRFWTETIPRLVEEQQK